MRIVEVTSVDDPRIHLFRDLTDVQLRLVREPAEGIFLAEGLTVISRALAAGLTPVAALMQDRWLAELREPLTDFDIDVCVADELVLRQITGFRLHRGALVAFQRFSGGELADIVGSARTLVILEDLVDHTNVGLIFRSAAALGADAVLLSPRCGDPLYRRSVKVSMGAVFNVPWARAQPWPWLLDDLRSAGFDVIALTPAEDATPISSYQRSNQVALLLGSEGPGLSSKASARASHRVRIPMANGIDSLNVAATAAVVCYALAQSETG